MLMYACHVLDFWSSDAASGGMVDVHVSRIIFPHFSIFLDEWGRAEGLAHGHLPSLKIKPLCFAWKQLEGGKKHNGRINIKI